jgi:hypothetical protein
MDEGVLDVSNEKPNIIFLDMDGPICHHRACVAMGDTGGMTYLDPIALMLVKRLCGEHNAKIVISSSWRTDYDLLGFQTILGAACPGLGQYVYAHQDRWRTISYVFSEVDRRYVSDRGLEISQWLEESVGKWNNYVIFDDMADMRPVQDHLVRTSLYDGISFMNYLAAKKMLSGEEELKDFLID